MRPTGMRVDELAQVPLSFPTYVGILGRAAYRAARQAVVDLAWQQAPHTGEQT
ncbi:MAG: hypothetical protein ACRDHF_15335 [Tepidiformaceae bacterium]